MEQFSGNYTGPYWSDGKIQSSVEFGETDPLSELDALSRLHDTAYAHYSDRAHREAADLIYARDSKILAEKYPELIGNIVQYGNYAGRQTMQLAKDVSMVPGFPLVGLGKFAITNLFNANKMVKGTYLKDEEKDVRDLYDRDPRKGLIRIKVVPKVSPGDETTKKETALKLKNGLFDAMHRVTKGLSTLGKPKGSTQPPETKEQRNERLINAQARRVENYQNIYQQSLVVPSGVRKYKKKKYNLKKATRILPAHCIH